jgi:aldehyde dehydrogenase (NAD+)
MQDEIFGPVLVSMTFRTPEEAVALANNSRYGLAASLWTENVNLALDMAPKLRAGVVWVNGTNMLDAAAGFGGMRESGFGREGGREGMLAYLRPAATGKPLKRVLLVAEPAEVTVEGIDRTAKLYVGGKQVRPDGGYSRAVWSPRGRLLGHAGLGNRKDIRNAVEAAHAARGWARATAWNRAQVLYYMAENLSARAGEFAARLRDMTGRDGTAEVAASVDRLFACAAWADKWDGAVRAVPLRGVALAMHEPVGVAGVICPDEAPLLGLVSLVGPLMALGNTCVVVPSEAYPLAATDLYQVLDTSDVPGGVVNIVTGAHADLTKPLASHLDVDAVWCFSSTDLSALVEREAAGNVKRTWVNYGRAMDWAAFDVRAALRAATEVRRCGCPTGNSPGFSLGPGRSARVTSA